MVLKCRTGSRAIKPGRGRRGRQDWANSCTSLRRPVRPLLVRTLDADRSGDLLAVADDDVGISAIDAVPAERGQAARLDRARGSTAAALHADGDDRVGVRARAIILEDKRG